MTMVTMMMILMMMTPCDDDDNDDDDNDDPPVITRWPSLECCHLSSLRQSGHKYTTLQLYKCTNFCSIPYIRTSIWFRITQIYNIQLCKEPSPISQTIPSQSQIYPCTILTLGKIGSQWADGQGNSRRRITTPPPQKFLTNVTFEKVQHNYREYNSRGSICQCDDYCTVSICQCDGSKGPPVRRLRHPWTPHTHHLDPTKTCHIWGTSSLVGVPGYHQES